MSGVGPKSDADLWAIYADKLRGLILKDAKLTGDQRLYLPSLKQGIPGGSWVPTPIFNYGVYKAGDALVPIETPFYVASNESYARRCLSYLQVVILDSDSQAGVIQVLQELQEKLAKTSAALRKLRVEAEDDYDKKTRKVSLYEWEQERYPEINDLKQEVVACQQKIDQLRSKNAGPQYQSLQAKMKLLGDALVYSEETSQNMEVSPQQLADAGNTTTITKKNFAPSYTLDGGYGMTVKNWRDQATLDVSANERVWLKFTSNEASSDYWGSVGFKNWSASGSVGYFPFFRVNYTASGQERHEDVHITESSAAVTFELMATGIQEFDVRPGGNWDPGNIQKEFPKTNPKASQEIITPLVQIKQAIVGYNVSLRITLGKALYDRVMGMVSNAQSHSGGATASFFGFNLNLGASGSVSQGNSTSWDKVKQDSSNYSVTIPGANSSIPVTLGFIGQVVGN